jgi:hypothetical protein
VKLRLNRTGQELLTRRYTLASTVALGGTTQLRGRVTFTYPLIVSLISYTWGIAAGSSLASELTVTQIPRGGRVTMICHGGGCPFSERRFAARHGQVNLLPALERSALRPGAVLRIDITAANRVGKVATFTIRSGLTPSVTRECLPPGAKQPARCVTLR